MADCVGGSTAVRKRALQALEPNREILTSSLYYSYTHTHIYIYMCVYTFEVFQLAEVFRNDGLWHFKFRVHETPVRRAEGSGVPERISDTGWSVVEISGSVRDGQSRALKVSHLALLKGVFASISFVISGAHDRGPIFLF